MSRVAIGQRRDIHDDSWPSKVRALGTSYVQSGSHPLRNADTLLFGDRRDDCHNSVLKGSAGIEILLREAPISDPACSQSARVLKSFEHPLP